MEKKTEIIKEAFDKLYNDLGNNLDDLLSKLENSKEPWTITVTSPNIKVGSKWFLKKSLSESFLLLQIEESELGNVNKKFRTPKGRDYRLADRFYTDKVGNAVTYNALKYPGSLFLLSSEWGANEEVNRKTCELINEIADDMGKDPYIPEESIKVMTGSKKKKETPDHKPDELLDPESGDGDFSDESTRLSLNLILYGPPGTGKTYNTIFKALDVLGVHALNASGAPTPKSLWFDNGEADRKQAIDKFNEMKDAGRIVFTTFHQSMNYEDFIEGIKPNLDGTSIGYKIQDGIFKQVSKEAAKHRDNNYVLIIDEINRGNVANIFGELITLIEDDKRTTKWDKGSRKYIDNPEGIRVKLPYSHAPKTSEEEGMTTSEEEIDKEEFGVPGNLYIIGTMNTADRSVEALDSALRRRFTFEELMPKPELFKDVKIKGTDKTLEDLLKTINNRIEALKDREHQIGHSYFKEFIGKKEVEPDKLEKAFTVKIIPLLQEYFYGDYEKIRLVVGDGFVKKIPDKIEFAGGESYEDLPERYFIEKKPDMMEVLKNLMNVE